MESELRGGQTKMIMIGVGALVLVFVVWWFFFKKSGGSKDSKPSSIVVEEEKPTIYGSLGCPYTIKQMEKYKNHEFVDCSSGGCPSFVTAYPTTKWPSGKIEVGFS